MLISSLVLTIICFTTLKQFTAGEDNSCTLDNRKYRVGETWHPVLKPLGTMPCVNCSCLRGGKVNCISEKCEKPDCEVPEHIQGQCCPICRDHVEDNGVTAEPLPGCEFNDVRYNNGEVFPSNKTGLKKTRNDQCVMCVCSMGHVLCHLKTCLPVKCKKIITTGDDCCPHCEGMIHTDHLDYEDYFDSILSDPIPKNQAKGDCKSMGYNGNSTSWHPVVGLFGEMKCITCRCLNGKVECGREKCVSDELLPCKKPRLVPGVCCKSCPKRRKKNKNKNGRRKKKKGRKKNRRKNKNKRDKPKRSRKRKKGDVTTSKDTNNTSPCLPRHADRFLYLSEKKSSIVIAWYIVKENRVEVNTWSVIKGRLSRVQVDTIDVKTFNQQYTHLNLIGATNKRRYKKTKKKLTKKLARCLSNCRKKVVLNSIKRLKTKTVTFSAYCDTKL